MLHSMLTATITDTCGNIISHYWSKMNIKSFTTEVTILYPPISSGQGVKPPLERKIPNIERGRTIGLGHFPNVDIFGKWPEPNYRTTSLQNPIRTGIRSRSESESPLKAARGVRRSTTTVQTGASLLTITNQSSAGCGSNLGAPVRMMMMKMKAGCRSFLMAHRVVH